MLDQIRLRLSRRVLKASGIDQIHIIGCSRSGTTVFQYAMVAFEKTVIHPHEVSCDFPFLGDSIGIARRARRSGNSHLITKRNYGWFTEPSLGRIVERAQREDMGIIYMVRDPRDVMSSTHRGTASDEPYVTAEHLVSSIRAGQTVLRELNGQTRQLVVRYEDLVLDSKKVEADVHRVFGLKLRDGVSSLAELRTNLEMAQQKLGPRGEIAMHNLRNLDGRSCGRWRSNGFDIHDAVTDAGERAEVEAFMQRYGYTAH